jgi:flagellar basal-body rod protein FlgF
MDRLLYTAMTGAKHAEMRQATVAHNLANASTPGFRAQLDAFRAVPVVGGNGLATRAFVVAQTTGADFSPGVIQQTGRELDVALTTEGWLSVQSAGGEAYTRNGGFVVDQTGMLKTQGGLVVQGENGPLQIPENSRVVFGADGTVSAIALDNPAQTVEVGRLKLVNPEKSQLEKGHDGLFRLRNGQPAQVDANARVTSGVIEGSNVNAVDELVTMISTQRHFDMQIKLMQHADQNATRATQILSLNA